MGYPSDDEKRPSAFVRERTSSSSSESSLESLKGPRTPRFAEATTVYSPIEPSETGPSPFADSKPVGRQVAMSQAKPSDVGFGYISENTPTPHEAPLSPTSPLKSAMKAPGTPGRKIDNPLSPTFREEQILEKEEGLTEKQQARDLKIKTRVRVVKLLLRGVNFGCSLIVLAMLSTTFHIFYATQGLSPKNNLPAWAVGTQTWPQYVVLVTSCVSLAFCVMVFYAYWRGGHNRAEKTAVYYTIFAVGFFIFSIVMWAFAAGILQSSKSNSGNQDVWGWSCVNNKRSQLFSDEVDYALVCRLQNWSLICCIIEVVVEIFTIGIYGVIFYRYYSKRQLRKSMDIRDKARSDLYLAQLRTQSAPNTPGFGPLSPSYSSYVKSPRFPPAAYGSLNSLSDAEEGNIQPGTRFVVAKPSSAQPAKPFALQAPPIKIHAASPKTPQRAFEVPVPVAARPLASNRVEHVPAAPGEQTYDAVPIPGAYASPASPGPQQQTFGFSSIPGQAVTSEHRIESPPSSPRLPRAGARFS